MFGNLFVHFLWSLKNIYWINITIQFNWQTYPLVYNSQIQFYAKVFVELDLVFNINRAELQ